jgi:hypothetical protein
MTTASEARAPILELHKTLLEAARRDFERQRGRVSPHEYLGALIDDPALAWLQPLTQLVVELHDLPDDDADAWRERVRALIDGDETAADGGEFPQRYAEYLHRHPELAFAHGAALRVLQP